MCYISQAVVNAAVIFAAPMAMGTSIVEHPVCTLKAAAAAIAILHVALNATSQRGLVRAAVALRDTALGTAIYFAVAVLFGAFLVADCAGTTAWALWMSTMTVMPASLALGSLCTASGRTEWLRVFKRRAFRSTQEAALFRISAALLLASWAACAVIPLDWNRSWQHWPIPNAMAGTAAATLAAALSALAARMTKSPRKAGGSSPAAAGKIRAFVPASLNDSPVRKSPGKKAAAGAKKASPTKAPPKKAGAVRLVPEHSNASPVRKASRSTSPARRASSPAKKASSPTRRAPGSARKGTPSKKAAERASASPAKVRAATVSASGTPRKSSRSA